MKAFHDVEIYAGSGCELATTGSRLELAATNEFLRSLFAGRSLCDGCREPLVIIFPEDDKNTVSAAFNSGLSIIQDPEKVHSLLSRLKETPRRETIITSSIPDPSEISTSAVPAEAEPLLVTQDRTGQPESEMLRGQEDSEEKETNINISSTDVISDICGENEDLESVSLGDRLRQRFSKHQRVKKKTDQPKQAKKNTNWKLRPPMKRIDLEIPPYDGPTRRYFCRLCEAMKISRSSLYAHYSTVHYKEELRSLIGRKTLQCQFCGFRRNNIEQMIVHVGSVHDKVEDFLPQKFHLPRPSPIKKRKYTKNFPASPVKLRQASMEQAVVLSTEPGASVVSLREEEIPRTMEPGSQDKETDSQTYNQFFSDIRNVFDDSDDSD